PRHRHQHSGEEPAPQRPAAQPRPVAVRGRDLGQATRHHAARGRPAPRQPLLGRVLLRGTRGRARGENRMTIERTDHAREKGIALVYMAVFLVPLLACTGLAVDLGRGYLVRVALARAVDAAALAAARNIADRVALITFSANTLVADPMRSERGFDLSSIDSHIDSTVANGGTATAEGLYQGWDQLRTVPTGSQSGLRIVLLFTDGSPNSV